MILRLIRFRAIFFGCLILAIVVCQENTNAASLQLTWSDNSQNENGFDIERRAGTTGTFSIVASLGANETTYTDSNLLNNATYCYRLRAFDSIGVSAYSNERCATIAGSTTTPIQPPTPVDNTISTNIADGAVLSGSSVIWTAIPSNAPSRVEFFIDGTIGTRELYSPYRFNGDSGYLNTNNLTNGSHQLKVRALYADSSIAERTINVTVSNKSTYTRRERRRN